VTEAPRSEGSDRPYGFSSHNCLQGREVRLRAIDQKDYPFLRDLELGHPSSLIRFRHRGVPTSPENWVQSLWHGVLSQFLVVLAHDERPVGLVTSYGADLRSGRSHVAIIVRPEIEGRGPAMEAMVLYINYLFAVFPLRKLTAEVIDFNWSQFAAGEGRMFVTEGVLKEHEFHDGRYWDVHLLAIFREAWFHYFAQPAVVRSGLLPLPGSELPQTFPVFAERLATEFGWQGDLFETTRLREDLDCDSIAYFELLTILTSLVDEDINEEALVGVTTLGELFQLFLAFAPHHLSVDGGDLVGRVQAL
jgi:RimJ/RimL family protein N-acetyltransferase/acyl carrier protein